MSTWMKTELPCSLQLPSDYTDDSEDSEDDLDAAVATMKPKAS